MKKNKMIKMAPQVHAKLKDRARQADLKIGQMVETLLGSLEGRMRKAYALAGISYYAKVFEPEILNLLFLYDQGQVSDSEFVGELEKLGAQAKTAAEWIPKMHLSQDAM